MIVSRFEYDTEHENFDAYSFFKTGRGVCQAYTLAYLAALSDVGVIADIATSAEMDHTWNKVMIDGSWYHVDVTWDDPVGSLPGEAQHKYFLMSDSCVDKRGKVHFGWESVLYESVCADVRYDDFFWEDVMTPFAPLGGEWYFITPGEEETYLSKTDFVTAENITVLEGAWDVLDEENMIWIGFFSGIFSLDGKIIYNTGTSVMKYDPVSGKSSPLGSPELGDSRIYGCYLENGKIMCVLAREPHSVDYTVIPFIIEN